MVTIQRKKKRVTQASKRSEHPDVQLHNPVPDSSTWYGSFIEILPVFAWQEEMIAEWAADTCGRIREEGGNWITEVLSEAEEEWLRARLIRFDRVCSPPDCEG